MRTIKFRAWDTISESILDWDELLKNDIKRILSSTVDSNVKLMQFTGLVDKNGKEVYEGDIIGMMTIKGTIPAWVIEWNAVYGSMRLKQIGKPKSSCVHWQKNFFSHYEVIGNIYANPEFLNHRE